MKNELNISYVFQNVNITSFKIEIPILINIGENTFIIIS